MPFPMPQIKNKNIKCLEQKNAGTEIMVTENGASCENIRDVTSELYVRWHMF